MDGGMDDGEVFAAGHQRRIGYGDIAAHTQGTTWAGKR